MAETIAVIEDVESRDITIQRGPKAGETSTVFNVKAGGKRYGTFNANLARAAAELRGQNAVIEFDVRESHRDGKTFTNYDLKSVKASDVQAIAKAVEVVQNVRQQGQSDKDLSIARAVALKAAVEIGVGGLIGDATAGVILQVADEFTDWLLNGSGEKTQPLTCVDLDQKGEPDPGAVDDGILVKF